MPKAYVYEHIVTPQDVTIHGIAPVGTSVISYTIHDKGVVMGQGAITPSPDGSFSLVYDAVELQKIFPMISLTAHEGRWVGLSDEVKISFLAVGDRGAQANSVTLIGEEVFVENDPYRLYLPFLLR